MARRVKIQDTNGRIVEVESDYSEIEELQKRAIEIYVDMRKKEATVASKLQN